MSHSTANREQTVKISLGPKGAFENGNIGALTRRGPVNGVGSGTPSPPPARTVPDRALIEQGKGRTPKAPRGRPCRRPLRNRKGGGP
jgi:hypothetical protein